MTLELPLFGPWLLIVLVLAAILVVADLAIAELVEREMGEGGER